MVSTELKEHRSVARVMLVGVGKRDVGTRDVRDHEREVVAVDVPPR